MPHETASLRWRRAVVGMVLLLVGVACWVGSRTDAGEQLSYAPGSHAPSTVLLTKGRTYDISLPGGVGRLGSLGLQPKRLTCTAYSVRSGLRGLRLSGEGANTKATNQLAAFTAPVGGRVRVTCVGAPPVFVDDADDATADRSGLLVLLATVLLTIGAGLTLSTLRRPPWQTADPAVAVR